MAGYFGDIMSKLKILLGVVAVFVILIIIGAMMSPGIEEEPTKIALFIVSGDPEEDTYYSVYVGLQDEKSHWVRASGKIILTIYDNNGTKLYEETKEVSASDYAEYTHALFGGKFIAVSWDIPVKDVKPGIPDTLGFGKAVVKFETKSGKELTKKADVIIPKLPPIKIKDVNVKVTGDTASDVSAYAIHPLLEEYGIAEIKVSITYLSMFGPDTITVDNIEVQAEGLELVKIEPSLPQTINNGGTVNLVLTVKAPNGYEGVPTIVIHVSG
jgi:drug/metabolite transporter superfamily protein YnfA